MKVGRLWVWSPCSTLGKAKSGGSSPKKKPAASQDWKKVPTVIVISFSWPLVQAASCTLEFLKTFVVPRKKNSFVGSREHFLTGPPLLIPLVWAFLLRFVLSLVTKRFLLVRARSLLLPGGQGRLSFIGHSAGAIIIRLALTSPSLKLAIGRLHLLVTLGSPHLGTVYGASGIVRTGMWAMKR